jgi:ATP-dependent Clp protease ATP-binding subunit ClpC
MFEIFTPEAIKSIMLAQEESRRLGHNFVGTEQILLGLIGEQTGIAAAALMKHGVKLKDARIEVEKIIGRGSGFVAVEIPFTPRAKKALDLSKTESLNMGCNFISTEHILLAIISDAGVAARVLENLGVPHRRLRETTIALAIEKGVAKKEDQNRLNADPERDKLPISGFEQSVKRSCPVCGEEILAAALICRYCREGLSETLFKKCPFCAESIRRESIRCRYCSSDVK